MFSPGFKRFSAALRMTDFYCAVWWTIRESPIRGLVIRGLVVVFMDFRQAELNKTEL